MIDFQNIYPEIFLTLTLLFLLVLGVFLKNSFLFIKKLTILSLFLCVPIIYMNFDNQILVFNNNYSINIFSNLLKIIILVSSAFSLIFTGQYLKRINLEKFEYMILILSSTLGMFIMVSTNNLIGLYLGIELQSLSLYVLSSVDRNSLKSSESGVKYFVLGALSSGLFLYGCSLVYGFTGSTNYLIINENFSVDNIGLIFGLVFIIVGLAFKVSAVPFHMWTPDVYEGSPTSVTAFFALAPKVAGIGAFIQILFVSFEAAYVEWRSIIIFISIASMILGSVAAIGQTNIKRLMAYSSIGHMGYALAGLATGTLNGISATLSYILIYVVMNIAAFTCILFFSRNKIYFEDIRDLGGLSKNHPVISICFCIILFSLAGIPPLAGFFAKFYIFKAVIDSQMYTLAIIGLLSSVVAAFYYLRVIKIIYFDKEKEKFDEISGLGMKFSLSISSIIILFYFISPSFLINLSDIAAKVFN
jgi:NADH-quinone oxidoreductase subunit N